MLCFGVTVAGVAGLLCTIGTKPAIFDHEERDVNDGRDEVLFAAIMELWSATLLAPYLTSIMLEEDSTGYFCNDKWAEYTALRTEYTYCDGVTKEYLAKVGTATIMLFTSLFAAVACLRYYYAMRDEENTAASKNIAVDMGANIQKMVDATMVSKSAELAEQQRRIQEQAQQEAAARLRHELELERQHKELVLEQRKAEYRQLVAMRKEEDYQRGWMTKTRLRVYHRAKHDFKIILGQKWLYHWPLPECGFMSRAQQATWWTEGTSIACKVGDDSMTFQVYYYEMQRDVKLGLDKRFVVMMSEIKSDRERREYYEQVKKNYKEIDDDNSGTITRLEQKKWWVSEAMRRARETAAKEKKDARDHYVELKESLSTQKEEADVIRDHLKTQNEDLEEMKAIASEIKQEEEEIDERMEAEAEKNKKKKKSKKQVRLSKEAAAKEKMRRFRRDKKAKKERAALEKIITGLRAELQSKSDHLHETEQRFQTATELLDLTAVANAILLDVTIKKHVLDAKKQTLDEQKKAAQQEWEDADNELMQLKKQQKADHDREQSSHNKETAKRRGKKAAKIYAAREMQEKKDWHHLPHVHQAAKEVKLAAKENAMARGQFVQSMIALVHDEAKADLMATEKIEKAYAQLKKNKKGKGSGLSGLSPALQNIMRKETALRNAKRRYANASSEENMRKVQDLTDANELVHETNMALDTLLNSVRKTASEVVDVGYALEVAMMAAEEALVREIMEKEHSHSDVAEREMHRKIETDMERKFHKLDSDGSDSVTLREFCDSVQVVDLFDAEVLDKEEKRVNRYMQAMEQFRHMDKDENMCITKAEQRKWWIEQLSERREKAENKHRR